MKRLVLLLTICLGVSSSARAQSDAPTEGTSTNNAPEAGKRKASCRILGDLLVDEKSLSPTDYQRVVDALLRQATDEDAIVRRLALSQLAKVSPTSRPQILATLDNATVDDVAEVRRACLESLTKLLGESEPKDLRQMLDCP